MKTITIELPDTIFSALRLAPKEFVNEMRVAAAVQWYAQQKISQSKAAEIADVSRVEFLNELLQRKIPAIQITIEELQEELESEW